MATSSSAAVAQAPELILILPCSTHTLIRVHSGPVAAANVQARKHGRLTADAVKSILGQKSMSMPWARRPKCVWHNEYCTPVTYQFKLGQPFTRPLFHADQLMHSQRVWRPGRLDRWLAGWGPIKWLIMLATVCNGKWDCTYRHSSANIDASNHRWRGT